MSNPFVPGDVVVVDGVEYYEITGYGIDGRLLIEKKMVNDIPVDQYDDFIEKEILRALRQQNLRKEVLKNYRHD